MADKLHRIKVEIQIIFAKKYKTDPYTTFSNMCTNVNDNKFY